MYRGALSDFSCWKYRYVHWRALAFYHLDNVFKKQYKPHPQTPELQSRILVPSAWASVRVAHCADIATVVIRCTAQPAIGRLVENMKMLLSKNVALRAIFSYVAFESIASKYAPCRYQSIRALIHAPQPAARPHLKLISCNALSTVSPAFSH